MYRMKLAAVLLAALVAGCAQVPFKMGDAGKAEATEADTQSRYEQGLKHYRENRFDAALADLNAAVAGGGLSAAELANARKHLAFMHCMGGRELQCREQFQALLKADPDFDLAANEAGHPQWGPVWRSAKGLSDQQRALSRASGFLASAGQQKLTEGIKHYEAGRYKEALVALQAALQAGLRGRTEELLAHKHSAFAYCLSNRARECRAEFKKLFAKDANFELLPSEAGHPAWAKVYRAEKAAARKSAAKMAQPATTAKK
jgi:tetratricopeptide (TPR) repeat protein